MAQNPDWVLEEFQDLLGNTAAVFFKHEKKKDNTVRRQVVGTLNPKSIPANKQGAPVPKYTPGNKVIPYFDLEIGDWRSMSVDSEFLVLNSFPTLPKKYR